MSDLPVVLQELIAELKEQRRRWDAVDSMENAHVLTGRDTGDTVESGELQ